MPVSSVIPTVSLIYAEGTRGQNRRPDRHEAVGDVGYGVGFKSWRDVDFLTTLGTRLRYFLYRYIDDRSNIG